MKTPLPPIRLGQFLCLAAWLAAGLISSAQSTPIPVQEQPPAPLIVPGPSPGERPVAKQPATAGLPETQKLEVLPWRTPPLELDLNGGFAGVAGGNILAAGAEKSTPPAAGLALWFISRTGADQAQWHAAGLSVPAWAATAQWEDTIACIGGMSGGKPVARAMLIGMRDGKASVSELPPLPKPLAGAGACVVGRRLYVFGGISSAQPLILENSLWSLDLSGPGAAWTGETPLPGAPRAFAAVAEQYDAVCVIGGLVIDGNGNRSASSETWLFRAKPPEASLRTGWSRGAAVPRATLGAIAFAQGQSSVVLAGGEEKAPESIFPTGKEYPPQSPPLIYQTVTDAWCPFAEPIPFATIKVARSVSTLSTQTLLLGNPSAGAPVRVCEFEIVRTVRTLSWVDYVVVACYFAFISFIGALASRHQKSSGDFSLAGRTVPWWVAGISMFATGASAISFMAIPALAFSSNLVFLFPTLVSFLAYFVQSRLIFPLLRRMEITSTYEYLERRFNKTLRMIASAQCILFQTFGRAAVVLVLPSLAISATTGISVYLSLVVMWLITTVYTAAGGFHAVVWTDVFQGILKFTAPLCMIAVCIFSLPGGPREFIQIGLSHHKFDFALMTWNPTVPAVWILFINSFLAFTIVQAGDQPVIQRVFSSPEKEVRRVAAMNTACSILISLVVNVLGIAIFAYFHSNPARLDPLAQNDQIVPLFVIQALPHGFIGMVIAAIFASAMTTVASSMNSSATVFTEDFYLRFKPDATDKTRVRVLRVTSTLVGIAALGIALLLATLNLKSLMVTWTIISALLGGGIVGVYSLGMFTRRANGFGAVCGAIISVIVTALVQFKTPLHWQTLIPIAIFSCMGFGYVLSLVAGQAKDLAGLTIYTPKQAAPIARATTARL